MVLCIRMNETEEDININTECMNALSHTGKMGTHLVQVRVPHDLWEKIRSAARAENRSVNNLVITVLKDHIRAA